jgi:hypothetical protein
METRADLRARRLAANISNGEAIFATLRDSLPQMIKAAGQALPAVTAVSRELNGKFGADMARTSVRQFVGLAIRAIMEGAGYEVAQQGIRINADPLFSVGAVYRRRADGGLDGDDPLIQMLSALSNTQAKRAFQILTRKFPELLS